MEQKNFLLHVPDSVLSVTKTFLKGSRILDGTDHNNCFYILLHGKASVYLESPNGDILAIYQYTAPDFFGEMELFLENRQPLLVLAQTDCTVQVLQKAELFKWMRADFSFVEYIMGRLCGKVIEDSYQVAKLAVLTIRQRYLYSLYHHQKLGDLHSLTKDSVLQEVNAPIRSLNRVIAECGAIVSYRKKHFSILDQAALLADIQEFDLFG